MTGIPGWWLHRRLTDRLLSPLGALYATAGRVRRRYWQSRAVRLPVPVLVVGNLFVGGSGKTPLVIHLAEHLRNRGRRCGVVLRGYGGGARHWPQRVAPDSDPAAVGDEAVLIARRTGCPVAAGPDRVAAARLLVEAGCDLIVSDDGMQHYRLHRDAEIAVVDAARGLGNRRCLPAGPLREPPDRLADVDIVVAQGAAWPGATGHYALAPGELRPLSGDAGPTPHAGQRVHAVAGIGHPGRFFATLRTMGYEVIPHAFADHHAFVPGELDFGDGLPVIMTEKDAVKCPGASRAWFLPVTAVPDPAAAAAIDRLLDRLTQGGQAS